MATWTSKLGGKYDRDMIQRLDSEHHEILKKLRKEGRNAYCAECGEGGTCWASVSLGVFLCVRCSDIHRALGTHISKVKGCSGTYLWGPDEIARMREVGNARAEALYGGAVPEARPTCDATKEQRMELCRQKYEQRRWAPKVAPPQERSRPLTGSSDAKAAPLTKPADLIDFDAFFGESPDSAEPAACPPSCRPAASGAAGILLQAAQGPPPAAWPRAQSRPSTGSWAASPAPLARPADLIDLDSFFGEPIGSPKPAGSGGDGSDAPRKSSLAATKICVAGTPAQVPVGIAPWPHDDPAVWDNFGVW